MFKKIMNKTILGITASIFMMAQGAYAFEVKGESFPANFNITSWTAGNGESTITSEGVVGEGYGKVYLTHHFTCLLYTSPSPRDRTRSRMPSSA